MSSNTSRERSESGKTSVTKRAASTAILTGGGRPGTAVRIPPSVKSGDTAVKPRRNTATRGNTARLHPKLKSLCDSALQSSGGEEVQKLVEATLRVDHELNNQRQKLRKQTHDFQTLFEIVGQTSLRSLDLASMQTYLLRTVSGHYTTKKLMIVRRMKYEDPALGSVASQGVKNAKVTLPIESPLCQFALSQNDCFLLSSLPEPIRETPEVKALAELNMQVAVPLIQELESAGAVLEGFFFLGPRLSGATYNRDDLEFLRTLAKLLAICMRNETLYRRSIIDDLTGVSSRGHFDAQLSQEMKRISTYGHKSMGLLLLDVDHFKKFNDTHGHQTGDLVLQGLARVLVHQIRNVDLVARYGGEEFAVILLEIDRQRANEVADRLRKAIEDMQVKSISGTPLHITASIGLAMYPEDAQDKQSLIQLADIALFRSKDAGRNRVTIVKPAIKAGAELQEVIRSEQKGTAFIPAPDGSRKGLYPAIGGGTSPEVVMIRKATAIQERRARVGAADSGATPKV